MWILDVVKIMFLDFFNVFGVIAFPCIGGLPRLQDGGGGGGVDGELNTCPDLSTHDGFVAVVCSSVAGNKYLFLDLAFFS